MNRRLFFLLFALGLLYGSLPAAASAEEAAPAVTALCVAEPGQSVPLDLAELQLLCQQATGHDLVSISFSPLSPRVGTLACEGKTMTSQDVYFLHERPLLSQLQFTPYSYRSSQFTGQAEISFTMTNEKEDTVSGTLILYVPEAPQWILPLSQLAPMDVDALDELCRQKTGSALLRLSFREPHLPFLSYDRGEGESSYITKRMTFYAHPSTENERDLSKVSLSASSLPYIYLTVDGSSVDNQGFSAKIRVDMPERETGWGTLVKAEEPIFLMDHLPFYKNSAGEIVCKGGRVTSVSFSLPPTSQGSIWLDHGDRKGRKLLPEETFHPDDGFNLYRLTLVPAKWAAGPICLDYAFVSAEGGRQEGTLFFRLPAQAGSSSSGKKEPTPQNRDPAPAAVSACTAQTGLATALYQACAARELGALESVVFDTLPTAGEGVIQSAGLPVSAGTAYPYHSLSFLPGDTFQGNITLRYVGVDSKKLSFSGALTLDLALPPDGRFQDLSGWEWATYAARFLDEKKAVPYSRSDPFFRPGENATRMELVYALVQVAYPTAKAAAPSFPDLPANEELAGVAAVAIAHGLLHGDEEGRLFLDSQVTRQDALVLLHRALSDLGQELPPAGSLALFSDAGDLSPYAREAAAVLCAKEVLQGDGSGHLDPLSPITRAEMACLLYRAFSR